jgi:GT2 family glycosyltransferase
MAERFADRITEARMDCNLGGTGVPIRMTLLMLTYNRAQMVEKVMAHNVAKAGCAIDELIWVDNGSTDGVRDVMSAYRPDVTILNATNLGVSKGWNRAIAVATGDFVIIPDSDMLMPEGWLMIFRSYITAIPNTGVVCMPIWKPGRVFKNVKRAYGLEYIPGVPIGRRVISRQLLVKHIGYLREDFGLYGWEDVEWGHRAIRVCSELGYLVYVIPHYAHDLSAADADPREYTDFKTRQGADPEKIALLKRCQAERYPYFNPFC